MRRGTYVVAMALVAAGWAGGLGCGGGESKDKDISKAFELNKAEKKEAEPEQKAGPPPEKKLELPWTFERVRDDLRGGVTLVYKQTGTNAKGKPVEDDYKCEIKKSSGTEVGTVCNGVNHPSKDKGATMVAMAEWSNLSPFFAVERVEKTLVGRESVTVPAGSFETVHAELKGFFGQHYDVWMIEDKPGIYAKVVQHPNTAEEGDKTEMTFELAEITMGGAEAG